MTMTARLKVSAKTSRDEAYECGRKDGTKWATGYADYDELNKLREAVEAAVPHYGSYREQMVESGENDRDIWDILNDSMFSDGYEGRDREPFFNEFIAGAVEGAVEAFEQVREDVEGN